MFGQDDGGVAGVSDLFGGGFEEGDGLPCSPVGFGAESCGSSAGGEVIGVLDLPVVPGGGILAFLSVGVTVGAGCFGFGTWASGTSRASGAKAALVGSRRWGAGAMDGWRGGVVECWWVSVWL